MKISIKISIKIYIKISTNIQYVYLDICKHEHSGYLDNCLDIFLDTTSLSPWTPPELWLLLPLTASLFADAEGRDKVGRGVSRASSKAQSRDGSRPPSAIENNIDYFKEPVVKVSSTVSYHRYQAGVFSRRRSRPACGLPNS